MSGVREDAAARRVIDLLAEQPVLAAADVAERLGVSACSGQSALAVLAERGIVERYQAGHSGPGRPTHYWVARQLVDLVSGWTSTTR